MTILQKIVAVVVVFFYNNFKVILDEMKSNKAKKKIEQNKS